MAMMAITTSSSIRVKPGDGNRRRMTVSSLPEFPARLAARITVGGGGIACPHVVGGLAQPFDVAIDEDGVEATAVAEVDAAADGEAFVAPGVVVALAVAAIVVLRGREQLVADGIHDIDRVRRELHAGFGGIDAQAH